MTQKSVSIFDPKILIPAIGDAFKKLNPRLMVKNPVMFVTLVGAVISTVDAFRSPGQTLFVAQIAIWLWFTVLFANFAEAVAEGRGKAQAKALRATRTRTSANKMSASDKIEIVDADSLRKGDIILVRTNEIIPADGEVILGAATVDESAITGESAPVIREAGGDRSAVTGGTRVLSDEIKIRITANPGEGFLDRMISLVEGASRQKTPNEIALTILLAALTVVFLLAVITLKPFGIYAGVNFSDVVLISLAGLFDSDDHRRFVERHRHRGHGSPASEKCPRDERSRSRGGGRRGCAAARQDRHHHARQPAGHRVFARARRHGKELADAAQLASLADETPEGRSIVVLAKDFGIRARTIHELPGAQFIPFTAQTRMSGVDFDGKQIRKGAANAIRHFTGGMFPAEIEKIVEAVSLSGGTPLVVATRDARSA
jgi:K+-transporting ATPase ATPase B chain